MDRKPRNNMRHDAAKAFMESLDQLQDVLGSNASSAASPVPRKPSRQPSEAQRSQPDLDAFEQAAADIEAFMQARSKEG